jgi:threonine ammonia-lyase medium form
MAPVSVEDIRCARERVAGIAVDTPLVPAVNLAAPSGAELWLKAENLQRTGSFKIRGAANAVASLDETQRARGVITYSSGNHGQAVACAANLAGVRSVVVMPEDAIPLKVDATRRWGAEIVFAGHTSLERQERAMQLAEEQGYAVIPPFDDPRIIAGQGTAGLEILEQLPEVETVVVPVGGGGLISGIATAVKELNPKVRVIGVEPAGAADAQDSLRRGSVVTWPRVETVADGLRTSRVGELNFATIREYVDDIVTVTEEEILRAVGVLAMGAKLVAEPSGATAPAAALSGRLNIPAGRVAVVISGGNVAPERLAACVDAATLSAAAVSSP